MRTRTAYLKIDNTTFGKDDQTYIDFDVFYQGDTLVPLDSKFIIDNLSSKNLYEITDNAALFMTEMKKIEFWCGYDTNIRRLFDGQILKAQPAGQPDTSLMISAWSSLYTMGTEIQVKEKHIRFLDLLERAVKECGFNLDITENMRKDSRLQEIVEEYSFTGSQYEFLTNVIKDITGNVITEDSLCIVIQNDIVSVFRASNEIKEKPTIEISARNGMIGIPEPNNVGIEIKTLLDVSLQCGMSIELKSTVIPRYNGVYNITGINHHGNARETEFYTDLQCVRCK